MSVSGNEVLGSTAAPDEEHVLSELKALAGSPGFVYTLAHAVAANTFIREEGSSSHQRLSVKELTLIAGLLASQPIPTTYMPDDETLTAQMTDLYVLLKKLHDVVAQPMNDGTMSRTTAGLSAKAKQSSVSLDPPSGSEMVEPFFYVGTGAYDFQYLDLASEKYHFDADWLASNTGLSIDLLVKAARELQDLREQRFVAHLQSQTNEERCMTALATFSFTRDDLSLLADSKFEIFVELFTVTPGGLRHRIESVGSVNELEFKPIIRLGEDHFFMPVGFMMAKAIYEGPFFWMTRDDGYRDRAGSHRGNVTEEIAFRLLSPIFRDRVYRNIAVVEVGSKQTIHEIDVLAVAGNRAVAIQAKSKRLTALSRQGDDEQIKMDFSQAVQEAYEQGLISRQLLLAGQHIFLDGTGKPLDLPKALKDVYLVCLTLDHFPALPYMTERLLERVDDDPPPVAVSLLDLEIIATYLTSSLDFLHYMYQRSRWSGRIHGSCEMSFLGWYLNRGLALPQEVQGVLLTESMAGLIDEDFPTRRGRNRLLGELLGIDVEASDDRGLKNHWQNSELQQYVSLLDKSPDPQATDAAFMLLDLPQEDASYFREKIVEAMNECNRTGAPYGCCIVLQDGSGISFVWVPESSKLLKDVLQDHADAYKYKHKSDKWLGLGGTLTSSDIALVFGPEPWQADARLDELARLLLHPQLQGKKPGRNQPCWCGSGRKYKKCHV